MTDVLLLLPDLLLILTGLALCRYTPLGPEVWSAVERLVYHVLFPALLFTAILRQPISPAADAPLVLAGLAVMLLGIALAWLIGRWPGVPPHLYASGAQTAFRFNSYVALALADRLAGGAGVAWMALVISVTVPVANIAAVWPLARQGGHSFAAELIRNPLIVSTVAGLVCNVLGLKLPEVLQVPLSRMGAAALALGLMSVGAGLRLGALGQAPGLATALLAVRHLAMPALCLLLVLPLLPLAAPQQAIVMAYAAMPTASSAYVLAVRMGGDGPFVAGLVTLSTLLGMLGLPVWLGLAQRLL